MAIRAEDDSILFGVGQVITYPMAVAWGFIPATSLAWGVIVDSELTRWFSGPEFVMSIANSF